jgi:hypothetical protein
MSRTKSPPPKDPRLDVPLGIEHLRGRGFYRTLFRERVFYDTSDWCKVCGRGISQRPYPGKHYVRGGYVTLRVIAYPDGSEWKQWEWVCRVCFKRFGELCGWTVLAGEPAPIRDFELHPAEPEVLPPEQCQEIAVNYTLQSWESDGRAAKPKNSSGGTAAGSNTASLRKWTWSFGGPCSVKAQNVLNIRSAHRLPYLEVAGPLQRYASRRFRIRSLVRVAPSR